MTPGKFEYHRPGTVGGAVAILGKYGDAARILAGGHTLVPMMKLRLASPEHLIDINDIDGLGGIRRDGDSLSIGAATTQAEAIASELLRETCPLIPEAAKVISDPQVRNRGTLGGNVANGDPANDMPAVMIALGASYVLCGPAGERQVAADAFYQGPFVTARADDEMLTEIRVPVPATGHGHAYKKLRRKVGDYATAAAAVVLEMDGGRCTRAAIALTNVGSTPIVAAAAAEALIGTAVDEAAIDEAGRRAADAADPVSDLHGPAAYRKQMAGEMTRRAAREALARAKGG